MHVNSKRYSKFNYKSEYSTKFFLGDVVIKEKEIGVVTEVLNNNEFRIDTFGTCDWTEIRMAEIGEIIKFRPKLIEENYNGLVAKILLSGVENCLFLVSMLPLNNIFGIKYTSSGDPQKMVLAKIDETRYPVEDNYKITLKSIEEGYGGQHYYVSDLNSSIQSGHVQFYIKQKL